MTDGRISSCEVVELTRGYQVSADGLRLLLIEESDAHHLTPLTLVLNWPNDPDLRRK
jgi:hypothetical protein